MTEVRKQKYWNSEVGKNFDCGLQIEKSSDSG